MFAVGSARQVALMRGVEYALKASEVDPDLASNWTTLAHLYYALRDLGQGQSRVHWETRCRLAIERAEAIDSYEARSLQAYKAEVSYHHDSS